MSSTEIWQNLQDSIYHRQTATNAFISFASIQEIWAGDRLERFSHNHQLGLDQAQIKTAKDKLLKIISILVGIGWPDWPRFKTIFFPSEPHIASYRRDENIRSFDIAELEDASFLGKNAWATNFARERWTYCPVVLDHHTYEEYSKEQRLPLVPVTSERPREGGYGVVTKEEIPAGHIITEDLPGDSRAPRSAPLVVARKRFYQGRSVIEKRILNLLRSNSVQHKRIPKILAIFSHEENLNIIFPWADMDLEDFLRGGYKEMESMPTLLDIIVEAEQLAGAIDYLHHKLQPDSKSPDRRRKSICHSDLKPRNIIVFKDPKSPSTGMWMISDFGISKIVHEVLSEMDEERTASNGPHSVQWAGTAGIGSYQSPDFVVHPKIDIWSFGCILVRLFALGFDPTSLEEFDRSRIGTLDGVASYNHDHFLRTSPPKLNPHVDLWIGTLPDRNAASYDRYFLNAMKQLLQSMLVINPDVRLGSNEVFRGLQDLKGLLLRSEWPRRPSTVQTEPESVNDRSGSATTPITLPDPPQSLAALQPLAPLEPLEPLEFPEHLESPRVIFSLGVVIAQIQSGNADEVQQLIQGRHDLENVYQNKRPLIYAIQRGDPPILAALLKHRPRLDLERLSEETSGQTPLCLAIYGGNAQIVKLLLQAGASPNVSSEDGMTPLMHAAHRGHADMISELLRFKADVTVFQGLERLNCLHYAVRNIGCEVEVIRAFRGHMDFDLTPSDLANGATFATPLNIHVLKCFELYHPSQQSKWLEKLEALTAGGQPGGGKLADINRNQHHDPSSPSETILETIIERDTLNDVKLAHLLVASGATLPADYTKRRYLSPYMKDIVKQAKLPSQDISPPPRFLRKARRTMSSLRIS
ncbi:hypothetical protein N7457_001475 [Penicillium paradoxum]|uniref:uncharacterized protein n=1 Tax=Penicillium paradoxum TaxID=176176 RepID=UPI0025466D45|nr:uncharacterized protein N7457_001475 [Penicillium paradoxum]KAJ5794876.1 hypothetical protein N7457_001475 [Penicillium paradoxum]